MKHFFLSLSLIVGLFVFTSISTSTNLVSEASAQGNENEAGFDLQGNDEDIGVEEIVLNTSEQEDTVESVSLVKKDETEEGSTIKIEVDFGDSGSQNTIPLFETKCRTRRILTHYGLVYYEVCYQVSTGHLVNGVTEGTELGLQVGH